MMLLQVIFSLFLVHSSFSKPAPELIISEQSQERISACVYTSSRQVSLCMVSTPKSVRILGGKSQDETLIDAHEGETLDVVKFGAEKFEKTKGKKENMDKDEKSRREHAIKKVLKRNDAALIAIMANELGKKGIFGSDYKSIMPFYQLALTMTKIKNKMDKKKPAPGKREDTVEMKPIKRWYSSFSYACPPNQNDECLGLCGDGCNCWSWLCGDCCGHYGCYEHDICCRGYWGVFAFACMSPFNFQCAGYGPDC